MRQQLSASHPEVQHKGKFSLCLLSSEKKKKDKGRVTLSKVILSGVVVSWLTVWSWLLYIDTSHEPLEMSIFASLHEDYNTDAISYRKSSQKIPRFDAIADDLLLIIVMYFQSIDVFPCGSDSSVLHTAIPAFSMPSRT
ncbi:expressed protein [Echinococcus multilocularis]|uniref:Expressed protein n=1 Tax=Echinococcus multilocularis TaxID=6211 RepID=A0A0S4MIG9_ECHMU|nr:expressed protein [Echinococcus multilocularis]